ncbi:MAG: cohesin domain-containing protein [Candidatus Solibacter sp.]|nr:cohesin domain-containing protein [Candidatus Solibacter sp.]
MYLFNRLTAIMLTAVLLGGMLPLEARTKKGDKFLTQGRLHEQKKEWDAALEFYEKALSEDPADIQYQIVATKIHFQAAQSHIDQAMKLRTEGQLGEALLEFQKAYAINPGSAAAIQEIRRTTDMIERERKRVQETGKEADPRERALTAGDKAKKETEDRIASILPVPELRPIDQNPINLRMTGTSKLLFETVAKVAGLNVLWDPEYQPQVRTNVPVEFENSTLEEALDYLAVITKSYWKPLSPNTIFITMDNPNKRRDYEEQVAKVFYLSNVSTPQELQEIVNAVRSVADIQRFFPYNAQNAIIAKGSADQVALAEKILHDLDKPKSEVVVDIIVMEASSVYTRQLTAAIASAGLNIPGNFTPRGGLKAVTDAATKTSTDTTTTGTSTTTTTSSGSAIPFSNLGRISSADFSTTIPSAMLQAVLTDANTKVLQSPQLRAVDNVKATMKIGDRQPTATGSFGSGLGSVGVGISPLMQTQFNFIDVGVNVEITPRVHDNGDVSLHIDLDISSVTGHVNLGGIDQPIIGQRKISHDIRMPEGGVQLLGGLTKYQESKARSGIPGLANIPILNRLFTSENIDRQRQELMIALIPHIVRRPEYTAENLRGIAVGNQQSVHLSYGRRAGAPPPVAPKQADSAPVNPPVAAANPAMPPASAAPATVPPMGAPLMVPPAVAPPMGAPGLAPPATAPPMPPPAPTPASGEPAKPAAPRPAGSAVVRFLPPQVETSAQGVVTVALIIENATEVSSAPLQVSFDAKVVKLNDAGRGDFFSSDGQIPLFTKNIQNDAGAAAMNLNRLPGTPGVSGSGVLTSLIFQAVAKGTTTVTIPNLTVRNAQGQVVFSGSPQMTITVK